VSGPPIYDDGQLRGIAYGSAGPGRRWVRRFDAPNWHPNEGPSACNGSCCWGIGSDDPRWLTDRTEAAR
jgi:hypothetical protein